MNRLFSSEDWRTDFGKVIFRECTLSPTTVNKKWKLSIVRKKIVRKPILIDGFLEIRVNSNRDEHEGGSAKNVFKLPSMQSISQGELCMLL